MSMHAESTTGAGHRVTGRCLCGAVRFSADAPKLEVGACHCSMCRRWASGPFLWMDCVGDIHIEGRDSVGTYRSSEWGERGFCRECGSLLFWRALDGSQTTVSAGALYKSDGLTFTTELFIDERPAYYSFSNATEKMTGAEFLAKYTGDANDD